MREGLQQSGSEEAAEVELHAVTVRGTEAWKAAARPLVVLYRAFHSRPGPYSHVRSDIALEIYHGDAV